MKLRSTDSISVPGKAISATQLEAMRNEQNNAVLQELGRAQLQLMQKRISAMEAELQQLRAAQSAQPVQPAPSESVEPILPVQSATPPALAAEEQASEKERKESEKKVQYWLIGASMTLLGCLLAIAWLIVRLRQLNAMQLSFNADVQSEPSEKQKPAPQFYTEPPEPPPPYMHPLPPRPLPTVTPTPTPTLLPPLPSSLPPPPLEPLDASFEFSFATEEAEPPLFLPEEERLDAAAVGLQTAPPGGLRNVIDYVTQTEILAAEEITDPVKAAESFIAVNRIKDAIQLLEQHIDTAPLDAPLAYLLLIDLYYQSNRREQFIAGQQKFQHIFNCKLPSWADHSDEQQGKDLEQMGPLMTSIEQMWPTDRIIPFLDSLLIDDRDGNRSGFELSAFKDIVFLRDLAKALAASNDAFPTLRDDDNQGVQAA